MYTSNHKNLIADRSLDVPGRTVAASRASRERGGAHARPEWKITSFFSRENRGYQVQRSDWRIDFQMDAKIYCQRDIFSDSKILILVKNNRVCPKIRLNFSFHRDNE